MIGAKADIRLLIAAISVSTSASHSGMLGFPNVPLEPPYFLVHCIHSLCFVQCSFPWD